MNTQDKGPEFVVSIPAKWDNVTAEALMREVWQAPKKTVHQLRMDKAVTLNGVPINWTKPLRKGDNLHFSIDERDYGVIPSEMPLHVLYEDEHMLIVNKPAGMNTHPNDPAVEKDTLANAVAWHLQQNEEKAEVQHIHRLDRDTTGAVIFAKHALAKGILDRLLAERKIKRTYWAITHGLMKTKKGTINQAIGRDRHHNTRRRVSPSGQSAITHYQVLEHNKTKGLTLVQLGLDTGRTHQIRVHMSSIGHPLAGDTLYGGKPVVQRQALHAKYIQLLHPLTEENISLEAPFLDDIPLFTAFFDL
ncbi:RluA family pseudouridine synthase [Rossellomorea vietnamensis]|uniref:Pseudouridine synthase n=1 Tax=Rossellomorea vietnamensis TaxID=218284 RepID=A0A5D4MD93_9BACI|nr:RluA family pseudouridine synthase [Rossellomorea vietnamensis]TYR99601.1 RluA family pseudouridine synthase [Rossellomorea vietnamensis]